ncbi:hypothetical protein ACIBTV_30375 [Micromonospora sp. NPDC049366]|uniref:hypothetical protein n=1 Tax=Micromonospora sp. NPDC049366 TaxID=3364271 RepID=UPI0037AA5D6B
MFDLSEELTVERWWTDADMDEVTQMLASRRSRLWQLADPADLAAWVFADPAPAPLDPAPADLDADWANGLNEAGRQAWAFAGWVARTVVPEPARTAGSHWLLSRLDGAAPAMLRLTVGVLEILGLYENGESVWLRLHGGPVALAMESGAADPAEWARRGVDLSDDGTKTLADEKMMLRCPDLATARWLLRQQPVIAGLRLLSCWVAAGPYSFEGRYRPEIVARAWRASGALCDEDVGAAVGDHVGFDRPYVGVTATGGLPARRSFDADAYRAGMIEHDRLCRALLERLAQTGVRAGSGLCGLPVDLAWRNPDGRQFVAEVKSVAGGNEVEQLRLGLGQVLEYRHRLAALGQPVTAVLVTSQCTDPTWWEICAGSGVQLWTGLGFDESGLLVAQPSGNALRIDFEHERSAG